MDIEGRGNAVVDSGSRPDTLAVPLAIVSKIPVAATRSTIKSASPPSSRISPSSSVNTSPRLARKRSGTFGESFTTPMTSYPSSPSTTTSPRVEQDRDNARARTRSTPLRPTSVDFSSSTKIPIPSKRTSILSSTALSPESITSETYRFPTPSPDLAAASSRSSRLFVDHNPSRDSLNPGELERELSRTLSRDVPDLEPADHNIKDEPAPFVVDRESLRDSPIPRSDDLNAGSHSNVLDQAVVESSPHPAPAGTSAVRRRAETMASTTSSTRTASIPTSASSTAKGRTAQMRQPSSKTTTPVKSSPSTRRLADSPSTLNATPTPSSSTRRTTGKTSTPVSRRLSRGPDSTLARGSPRAVSPGTASDFGRLTNSPSNGGLAEFPEAFLVPYIPQQTLPKGVRADEVPIPAVERRLMRERLAKEGLKDDELVTVWGLDGAPLMVSKASLAGGLPSGITESEPDSQVGNSSLSPAAISPSALPRRSSSKRSFRQPPSLEPTTPDPPLQLGPPVLDSQRSRKPSLTFASSSYIPPDGPESPAPFQSDRFVPLDQTLLAVHPTPEPDLRRKASLLRKPSISSRQRSQQSLRDRDAGRDLTSIRLEDLRPSMGTNAGHGQARGQPWDASVLARPPAASTGNTRPAPDNMTRVRGDQADQHGKKEGCKCLIM